MPKKENPNKIRNAEPSSVPMYGTWKEGEPMPTMAFAALKNSEPVYRAAASTMTVRSGLSRDDWDYHRPEEALPSTGKETTRVCMHAYKRNPIVRNVIDMMADFAADGVEIHHPIKGNQDLLRAWAHKVNLHNLAERFFNYLFRTGNVVLTRSHVKLSIKDYENLELGLAAPGPTIETDTELNKPPRIQKNVVPLLYSFKNPLIIDVAGGEALANFTGKVRYILRIPGTLITKIKKPANDEERLMVSELPDYIINAVRAGKKVIPLDEYKTRVFHYKKDDWETWAEPMFSAIIDDLIMLKKLKLADLSALDGAISHVRLWKLGSLEYKLYPTDAAVAQLGDMLAAAAGAGGAFDIIWGPDLEVKETSTDIYRFLTSDKYSATLISIYDGLGIPVALTGYGGKNGMGNNFLALQTLIKRLEYGRRVFLEFIYKELAEIKEAIGFRGEASIRFKHMDLADPATIMALYIQLADRNLISIESLQERFGETPELERLRQKKEARERESGKRLPQAGQWFNPEHDKAMEKIALQSGITTPSQHGLDLPDPKPGEESLVDKQGKQRIQEAEKKLRGQVGQGRPKGKTDTTKRKKKRVSVQRSIAEHTIWAKTAQEAIANILDPIYCKSKGKDSKRKLTTEEGKELENLKFAALCSTQPYQEITEEFVCALMTGEAKLNTDSKLFNLYWTAVASFNKKFNREPSMDEAKLIQASVYALDRLEV